MQQPTKGGLHDARDLGQGGIGVAPDDAGIRVNVVRRLT
jgi:hypothetical protein